MKSLKMLTALLLSMALVFSSCGTWNNTQKGAAIGVGGGAAVGAADARNVGGAVEGVAAEEQARSRVRFVRLERRGGKTDCR